MNFLLHILIGSYLTFSVNFLNVPVRVIHRGDGVVSKCSRRHRSGAASFDFIRRWHINNHLWRDVTFKNSG